MSENIESIQLLNTAIIKSKEKKLDESYDERLHQLCNAPAIAALNKAISYLAENQKISRDQSAIALVSTIRELDSIWNDYVVMEGIGKLKEMLGSEESEF